MDIRNLMYLIPMLRHIGKLYRKAYEDKYVTAQEAATNYAKDLSFTLSESLDDKSISFITDYLTNDNLSDSGPFALEDATLKKAAGINYGNLQASNLFSPEQHRLQAIASDIGKRNTANYFFHPQRMTLDLTSFPYSETKQTKTVDYKKLYTDFKQALTHVNFNARNSLSHTLYSIMYEFGALCPGFSNQNKDISLFDFAKIESALSISLYDAQKSNEKADTPFLLIGGDFSGIQKYIYQIVSKGAGKSLKGRSFYLRMLSDTIVHYLLDKLSLFQANVIYNSGGSFYLLAPNTTQTKELLQACKKEIEQRLLEQYDIALYCAIDAIAVSEKELMNTEGCSLRKVWSNLFLKRDKLKNKRYTDLIQESYDTFFTPSANGGEPLRDAVTGEEIESASQAFNFTTGKIYHTGSADLCVKESTYKQKELGKYLRESDYILLTKNPELNGFFVDPLQLGYYYYFLNERQFRNIAPDQTMTLYQFNLSSLKSDDPATLCGNKLSYNQLLIGGTDYPKDDLGYIKTFDELCTGDKDTFKRLGVLRMDVDNLGSIFQKGLSDENCSLTRYSALSRTLDWFFSGYLNTLWERIAPEDTYIVYSGGDDLFLIGEWTQIIRLAEEIRTEFKAYTCHNSSFSISGGIAIVPSKYPIMKGADESEHEEKRAKNYCNGENTNTKNAISFLKMPMNWEIEYPAVKAMKDQICEVLETGEMQKSVIGKMYQFHEMAKLQTKENNHFKPTNLRIYWLIAYDFGRLKQRCKNQPALISLIEQFEKDIVQNTFNQQKINTRYHALQLWYFAARWAELQLRSNN